MCVCLASAVARARPGSVCLPRKPRMVGQEFPLLFMGNPSKEYLWTTHVRNDRQRSNLSSLFKNIHVRMRSYQVYRDRLSLRCAESTPSPDLPGEGPGSRGTWVMAEEIGRVSE